MNILDGKAAVVTGGSKGIGAGIAKGLAAAGAAVVVNYASGRADAERVVAGIVSAGGRAVAVQADIAIEADIGGLFEAAAAAFGSVDILINNAGVFSFEPIEQITPEIFHWQFNVNVLGTLLATKEAVRHFPARGGSVINIGTTSSVNPSPSSTVYAASKGAVDTLTLALAQELGPRRIRVNVIAPGGVDTEGTRANGVVGSDVERQIVAATPLGRFGRPNDIAGIAVFLASDQARWVTGARIVASGGFK